MAKVLLAIFGWSAIALGFGAMLIGAAVGSSYDRSVWWVMLAVGAPFLLSGALLIGFRRIIELLEVIAGEKTIPRDDLPAEPRSGGWAHPASTPPHARSIPE